MTAPKKLSRPVLPKTREVLMDEPAREHAYPKDSGKYNIHVDKDGFFERGLDKHDMEIEYVPLPRDLPPSMRKKPKQVLKAKDRTKVKR